MKKRLFNVIKIFSLIGVIYLLFSVGIATYDIYNSLLVSPELQDLANKKFIKSNDKLVIAIMSPQTSGEANQAKMVYDTAIKQGHFPYLYSLNDKDMDMFLPAKYLNELFLLALKYKYKTDFHLAVSHHVNWEVPEPKYMYISVPPKYFAQRALPRYPMIKDYQNFIDINFYNIKENWVSDYLNKKVNRFPGIIGIPANTYFDTPRKTLVMFGSLWGRKTLQIYDAIKELANQDYMYFVKNNFLLLGAQDRQIFTDRAENLDKLQKIIGLHGIALCVHSKFHFEAAIPSSRIFEIISSSAIAISDKNPFLVSNFGDNVLYYDLDQPGKKIFQQIDQHVKWVIAHPEEAAAKAKKAHQILQANFTTEKFLENLIKIYLKPLNDNKN